MKTDLERQTVASSVKNIVISGTNFWNPGDDFVRDGVTQVLRNVFPGQTLNFLFYNFNADFFPQNKFAGISNLAARGDLNHYRDFIDAVVIAGLSAGEEIKDLYRWVIENGLQDRVYLIGAGYENNYVAHHILKEPEATIFRNARIIIGRTAKTPEFIPALGLQYLHLNCPALLSVKQVKNVLAGKRLEKIGFSIQLPQGVGLMNQVCAPGTTKLALDILRDLSANYTVELIAHHKTEYFYFLNLFRGAGIPVIFSSFYQDLHEIYPRYDLVITTRLHSSLFANGFGLPGIIVNDTDRHTHTLQGFPHSSWVNTREGFERAFERVREMDLAQVALEAERFKQNLMAKYVSALAAPFELRRSDIDADAAAHLARNGATPKAPSEPPQAIASIPPARTRPANHECGLPSTSEAPLPIHFFTIVVNGKPFIEHHIRVFKQLSCPWHWHIIEGIAEQNHDTAWSKQIGGRISSEIHRAGLSTDGTTEYLDDLARQFPQNITIYRKPAGAFWDGKLEMVNAPLANIRQECLLWQVDADELWTADQIQRARKLFLSQPDKTAAFYLCHYFVGKDLIITSRNTYGNHLAYEWLRTWRFQPGDLWASHEPPRLCRPSSSGPVRDIGRINPFQHGQTEPLGLVFQHYAYATEAQLRFKETYYGYAGAVKQWKHLQAQKQFPLRLADYFSWVKDAAEVNTIQSQGIVPLAPATWFSTRPEAGSSTQPARILFVRTDSIGDNVLAASMLKPLHDRFPNAELAVLCQEHIAELYVTCPYVKTVICYNFSKLARDQAYRESILSELRQFASDLILNSIYSREWTVESLLLGLRGSQAIGMVGNLANMPAANRTASNALYSKLIQSEGRDKTELDHHRAFLAGLDITGVELQPTVWTTTEDETLAEEFFKQQNLDPERTIALFPGSLLGVKVYPYFAQALQSLEGYRFLLFGGVETQSLCEQLAAQLPGPAMILAGRTTLREMASLIRRCRMLVGADSSGPHIACAVGVPNVVVMGGGQFGRFFPYSPLTSAVALPLDCYQCNWQCKHARNHCIRDLAPEVLAEVIRATLAKPASRPRLFVQARFNREDSSQPRWTEVRRFVSAERVEIVGVNVPLEAKKKFSAPEAEKREAGQTLSAPKAAESPASAEPNNRASQEQSEPSFNRIEFPQAIPAQTTPAAGSASGATPLVTAIVSTYKSERFIRGCLEDLERQTIADKLEIIVIDSASPQNERAIVEEFKRRYSNIVYIRTPERETLYAAWTRAAKAARGKFLTTANTDDRHRPDALEILARTLDQNPEITLAYADCLITRTENETFETAHPVGKFQWMEFNASDLLLKGCFVGPQPLWRREVHDEHGYFDTSMVAAGDYEFWLRIARNRKFLHVPQFLGLYLESPTSVEHTNQEIGRREVEAARARYGRDILQGYKPLVVKPSASASPKPSRQAKAQALPSCALIGHLGKAREFLAGNQLVEAWQAALEAVQARPFHPEGCLLLAEIAQVLGDFVSARLCAEHARRLAPGWKPARQFLKRRFKDNTLSTSLTLPEFVSRYAHVSSRSDAGRTPDASHAPCLSICIITKNEEQFLDRCLSSVRGLAGQIVLVDTGSTDRTLEIAKQHGAEIHHFDWCDDFGAARNAALEHARGDWILVLDADEELPADQHARLRTDLGNDKVIAFRLPMVGSEANADGPVYVPRLFRNAPGACFTGRIHEQVFPSLLPLSKTWVLVSELGSARLLHHGYAKEVMAGRNKIERNLGLLRRAIEEQPDDPNIAMNLGLELIRSGQLEAGLQRYQDAFDLMSAQPPREASPELREMLLTQFSAQLCKLKAYGEVTTLLDSPLAKSGGGLTASLHFVLGLAQFELHKFGDATEQMRQVLRKRTTPSLTPRNADVLSAKPYYCLALSLARLGDAAGAEQAFQQGLAQPGGDLKLDYAGFLASQNRPVEAIQRLHELVTENAQHAAAWGLGARIALNRPDFLEFALDWTGEAVQQLPEDKALIAQRAEALLLNQNTAAAIEIWARLWNGERNPRFLAALILSEIVEGSTVHLPDDESESQAASRAFVDWYRKCAAMGARELLARLNGSTEELGRVLPEAARMIEAALAQVQRPAEAELCTA